MINVLLKHIGFLIIGIVAILGVGLFLNKSDISSHDSTSSPTSGKIQQAVTKTSNGETPNISFNLKDDFTIHVFAKGLGSPRDLQFSPGGTLLVSNPASNQVIALPDKNKDGQADEKKILINVGNQVHGLAFFDNKLYVAEVNRVVRYNWDEKNLKATFDKILFTLPNNSNHNKRTIIFDDKGTMYISVGSTCNVCKETSNLSATILTADKDGNNLKVYASGLRNAPFMQFNPKTFDLWATEMGRDYLGDNIPPDEIDIIKSGKNYGWPNCYGDKIHDTNFDKSSDNSCASTESPIFEIPAHSAPLGLTFINSFQFPSDWQGDLLVAYHGSWNRSTPDGYKVVHLKVDGDSITSAEDFLTGFIPSSATQGSDAKARPVDLTFDNRGNLYLSDDKAGNIFIIQKKQ